MKSKKTNRAFIDEYSWRHLTSGVIVGLFLTCLKRSYKSLNTFFIFILIGFITVLLWELFEILLRIIKSQSGKTYKFLIKFLPEYLFLKESKMNIFGDLVFGTLGTLLMYLIF
jgi:dolichol kinase